MFGVTLDSVITGESAVAVPVGNTLSTKDRSTKPGLPPPLAVEAGPSTFAPIGETFLAEHPRVLKEVRIDQPIEARRLGIDGKVVLRVGIDRKGRVRAVRVIKNAGYGMDETATQALWRFKFDPARTKDGQTVDCQITYIYTFESTR